MSTTCGRTQKARTAPRRWYGKSCVAQKNGLPAARRRKTIVCSDCRTHERLGSNQGAAKSTCRDVQEWSFCTSSREPKQLRQEPLVGRTTERGPGEPDILQYVLFQLAKVVELSAPLPSSLPASQQTHRQAEPSAGHGVPRINPSKPLPCIVHTAERCL